MCYFDSDDHADQKRYLTAQSDEADLRAHRQRNAPETPPDPRDEAVRVLRAINDKMLLALEAHAAWDWAEHNNPGVASFQECMELSNYAAYLTREAMAAASGTLPSDYRGVPRIVLFQPLSAGIVRADAEEAQSIVDRILTAYRAALAATEPKPEPAKPSNGESYVPPHLRFKDGHLPTP